MMHAHIFINRKNRNSQILRKTNGIMAMHVFWHGRKPRKQQQKYILTQLLGANFFCIFGILPELL